MTLSNLRFANDTDLSAVSEDELLDLIQRLDNTATKYGMEISPQESKALTVAKDGIKLGFRTFRNLVRFQGVGITGLEVLCKDLTPGPTV